MLWCGSLRCGSKASNPSRRARRKNSYITWNSSLYAFLLKGEPFRACRMPLHQVLQHFHRRHDDHRAQGSAANRQDFGRVNQRADMAA